MNHIPIITAIFAATLILPTAQANLSNTNFPGSATALPEYLKSDSGLDHLQKDLQTWLAGKFVKLADYNPERCIAAIKDPLYTKALAQYELLRRAKAHLKFIRSQRPDGQKFLNIFMQTTPWIEPLFSTGPINLGGTLGVLHAIWKTDPACATNAVYRKIAFAAATRSHDSVKGDPTNWTAKYMWYRKQYDYGRAGKYFRNYTPYDMRWVVDYHDPLRTMNWDMFQKQSKGWRKNNNIYGTHVQNGRLFAKPWNWKYGWLKLNHMNPGVCGSVSRRGQGDLWNKGIAACGGGQPGHAVWGSKTPGGDWVVNYSVHNPTYMDCSAEWNNDRKQFRALASYYNDWHDVVSLNRYLILAGLLKTSGNTRAAGAAAMLARQHLPLPHPLAVRQLDAFKKEEQACLNSLGMLFSNASARPTGENTDPTTAKRGILRFKVEHYNNCGARRVTLTLNTAHPHRLPPFSGYEQKYIFLTGRDFSTLKKNGNFLKLSPPAPFPRNKWTTGANYGVHDIQLGLLMPNGKWIYSNLNTAQYAHREQNITKNWRHPKYKRFWVIIRNGKTQQTPSSPPIRLDFISNNIATHSPTKQN